VLNKAKINEVLQIDIPYWKDSLIEYFEKINKGN
jgi:hypothetical protein